jgi:serine/threonine-protein kinase
MKLEPGSKIGDYEVLGQLGAGGMGRVYKVRNELSDRVEAMKVLLPDLEGHADLASRFLREIKVQANLDHPNIAKLYTALRIDNQLLMCMELVEGIGLDERLRQGPISLVDAVDYAVQVLSALEYAHQRGVVHRDIKPANMMLMRDGKIKLLDFGIAKASDTRLTVTGTTLGSLYYMSPEQIQGAGVDVRSDVYSLGVSLYELVTGKKPFDAESQFAILSAHLARMPVPPIEVNDRLPVAVSNVILTALNKDPGTRFQTAGEFLDALRAVQEEVGYGTATMPPAAPPRTNVRGTRPPVPPLPAPPSHREVAAPTADIAPPLGDSLRMTAVQRSVPEPSAGPAEPSESVAEASNSGSKRVLWIAVGSLCAVIAIVAFIQIGPKRKTAANERQPAPFTANQPSAAASTKPSAMPPPAGKRQSAVPSPAIEPRKDAPPQRAQTPAQANPAPSFPDEPPARAGRAAPASLAAPSSPDAGSVPAKINQDRLEIQQMSSNLDLLYIRARAARATLQDLQNNPGPQGGPKTEWVESFNRLNQLLRQATAGINDGNQVTASDAMAKAAKELEGLEKALGK